MKKWTSMALVLWLGIQGGSLLGANPAWAAAEGTDSASSDEGSDAQGQAAAEQFVNSLHMQKGDVELPNGVATLHLGDQFYYLDPADSKRVLEDAWGNPPGSDVQGMIFPVGHTPLDNDSWGVTVEYEEDGYVSDEDAAKINYDDLLKQMQDDTREASKEQVKAGFGSVELVGWAARPYYDAETKKLHWAKELKFDNSPDNTLNYNIRVLGRKGVLVLNFIADMKELPVIQSSVDSVLAAADFNPGNRYADFNPSMDKVAAYGIGALVAGKVLAKTGFFIAALLLLKKFGIVIVGALGVMGKKLLGRKSA